MECRNSSRCENARFGFQSPTPSRFPQHNTPAQSLACVYPKVVQLSHYGVESITMKISVERSEVELSVDQTIPAGNVLFTYASTL